MASRFLKDWQDGKPKYKDLVNRSIDRTGTASKFGLPNVAGTISKYIPKEVPDFVRDVAMGRLSSKGVGELVGDEFKNLDQVGADALTGETPKLEAPKPENRRYTGKMPTRKQIEANLRSREESAQYQDNPELLNKHVDNIIKQLENQQSGSNK